MKLRRAWCKRVALFLVASVSIMILLHWFEHSQVYHPDRFFSATGAELGRPFEDVFFRSTDGVKLNGWFFPANPDSPRASIAVLFCHGNAGNISHRLGLCQTLLAAGINVFMFDYRGFGRSDGRPSEEGTYEDAQAADQWLQKKGFSRRNIIVYGESLGGGVASELALREPPGGLILQSTFTSIPDLGSEMFPWLPVHWLGRIKYETRKKLPRLHVPVLIMHSRADRLVGFHHAQANFAAANEPKQFCEISGGHNDALSDPRAFAGGIEKFLRLVETAHAASSAGVKPPPSSPTTTPEASPGGVRR